MPCVSFQVDGMRGIVCGRGLKPRRCAYCGHLAEFACDWPKGKGTCSRPMCAAHSLEVDKDLHQCRDHAVPGLF
jgi:hypothetical protein